MLIGLLLAGVATAIALDTAGMLLGESAGPYRQGLIRDAILGNDDVKAIRELLTVYGARHAARASRVAVRDSMSVVELERLSDEIERRVQQAIPEVHEFFLDPTA